MFLKSYEAKQLFLAELYPWEAREENRAGRLARFKMSYLGL